MSNSRPFIRRLTQFEEGLSPHFTVQDALPKPRRKRRTFRRMPHKNERLPSVKISQISPERLLEIQKAQGTIRSKLRAASLPTGSMHPRALSQRLRPKLDKAERQELERRRA